MKKFLVIISFLFLIFSAEKTYACSCVYLPNIPLETQVTDFYKGSSAVFSAKVIEVNQLPNVYNVSVKLKVSKSWKGVNSKEIILTTGRGGGDCGYRFEVGEKYLIYAYAGENNILGTGICSRTALVEGNKDIKILNKLKKKKS